MLGLISDSHDRYLRFLDCVVENGTVWGLTSADGWCFAPSNEEDEEGNARDVMPFWSDRAYARQCARDEWAEYEPTPITLDAFMQAWLPGMESDGVLVGVNWNAALIGEEAEPGTLRAALEERMP